MRQEQVGNPRPPFCFSVLLVSTGSVLGGPTAVSIRAPSVVSHSSPPLKNKIHPSSHGLLLSHTTRCPGELLRLVERSWGLARLEAQNPSPLLCGFGQVAAPRVASVASAVKPEILGCSLRMVWSPMLHWPLLLPTLSSCDRAWPACYLESSNQTRNLVDKA